jgi:hypothetical protein
VIWGLKGENQLRVGTIIFALEVLTILRSQEEVPWVVEMMVVEASPSL